MLVRARVAGAVLTALLAALPIPLLTAVPAHAAASARTSTDPARDADHGHAWKRHPGLHGEADLVRTRVAVQDRVLVVAFGLRTLHAPGPRVQLQLGASFLLRSVSGSGYRTLGLAVAAGGNRRGAQAVALVRRRQVCPGVPTARLDVARARVVARLPVRCLPHHVELEGVTADVNVFVRTAGTVGGDTLQGGWTLRLR